MAESILKLRVESSEYDQKIKRAAEGLQAYAEGCRKAGGTLTQLDDGVLEFTKALGNMETVSKTARGSVSEMTKAFTELSVQYNKLTEEEKNSPFGKALAESLDTLKGRIKDGNTELKNIGTSLNDTGGILGQLKDKFTINIDALTLFNTGLSAAKAALDVAKDAFFASEANVDEWGRTMKAAEGVYAGFLNALNTGDFSGFLTRIDDIVKAAREAYNAMDTLQTMKTIQGPQFAKQEAENNRIRMMIQTGRWISASDGRKSPLGLKDGDLLSPAQIRILERQLQGGMQTIVSLTKNELKQTGVAIDAYYNSLAKQNGMSLSEFRQGTSNWGAFREKMAGYEAYKKWDAQARAEFARQGGQGYVNFDKSNPYAEFRKWGTFRVDKMGENSYNELVGLIKQQQQQSSQMYSTIGQAYRTINRAEGITVKGLLGGGSGGGKGGSGLTTEEIEAQLEASIASAWDKAMTKGMNAGVKALEIEGPSEAWQSYVDSIKQGAGEAEDSLARLEDAFKALNNAEGVEPAREVNKDVKALQDTAKTTAMVVGTIGQAFNAIEDPAAKVASTVAMAIANVALAYSDAMAKTTAEKFNIWSFIAAAAASTVSMVSTIASIHSATGYAEGGMIKGNSYSGDNLMAMGPSGLIGLNAGEIVLNQAQQANVASGLRGGAFSGMSLKTKVRGTELLVWLDNSLAQSGRGELVTWGQ